MKTFNEVIEALRRGVTEGTYTVDQAARHLHDSATARGLNIHLDGCRTVVDPNAERPYQGHAERYEQRPWAR